MIVAEEIARKKYRIIGKVQGVGLRVWIQAEAQKRNLHGWVRNEADGSVAALLIGSTNTLEKAKLWLREGTLASDVFDTCELVLEPNDLNWDASSGFHIL